MIVTHVDRLVILRILTKECQIVNLMIVISDTCYRSNSNSNDDDICRLFIFIV